MAGSVIAMLMAPADPATVAGRVKKLLPSDAVLIEALRLGRIEGGSKLIGQRVQLVQKAGDGLIAHLDRYRQGHRW